MFMNASYTLVFRGALKTLLKNKAWKEVHIFSHSAGSYLTYPQIGPLAAVHQETENNKILGSCFNANKVRFYGCNTGNSDSSVASFMYHILINRHPRIKGRIETCGSNTYSRFWTSKGNYDSLVTGWRQLRAGEFPKSTDTLYLESDPIEKKEVIKEYQWGGQTYKYYKYYHVPSPKCWLSSE